MGTAWARKIDAERGLASGKPHVPKAVNTLAASVEADVMRRLGEAVSQLGGAASAADQLLGRRAGIGEAAADVKIPDPAVIRRARSLIEELVDG